MNNKANSLLEKADELTSGEISLKDLYYDQLLCELLESDLESEEVERDEQYYVEGDQDFDPSKKFCSFNMTKNVMSQVKALAKAKEQAAVKPELKISDFKPLKTTLVNDFAPQTAGGIEINASTNATHGNANQLFSEQNGPNTSSSASAGVASASGTGKGFGGLFTRTNFTIVLLGFIATMFFGMYMNRQDSSSFSTIAQVEAPEQQPSQIATLNLPTANSPSAVITLDQLTRPDLLANNPVTSFKLNQGYQPVPISEGIKYVGLQVRRPIPATSILLESQRVTNLNILLLNYEIQKRIVTK